MSLLIYCIMRPPAREKTAGVNGVGEHPVSVVTSGELAAAVSDLQGVELTAETAQVLAYNRVVEAFHNRGTVIPLRWGSVCEDEPRVVKLLNEQAGKHLALLREFQVRVEIGIRILLAGLAACEPEEFIPTDSAPDRRGRAFLNSRRAHYFRNAQAASIGLAAAESCRKAFAGLFVKCREENPSSQRPLLSLYFLVPRESVEPFQLIFRQLSADISIPLLMSGPWPPYNFVGSDMK